MDLDATPVLIVGIVFASSVIIVATVFFFIHRAQEARLATIRTALERGQPVPPELLVARPRPARTDLQRGVILGALGAGISLFLAIHGGRGWGVGLILVALGIGFAASHALGRRAEPPAPGV